jgi:ATP-dependent DNA helicase RecG
LPAGWSVEKLKTKHASLPFNPDVANVFFEAGLVESSGRGIERMHQACREAGVPEPLFEVEETGLWTKFFFRPEKINGQTVGDRVGDRTAEGLSANQKRILDLLFDAPHKSIREVAAVLGISIRKTEENIAKLKVLGFLEREGSAKRGSWKVRFRPD